MSNRNRNRWNDDSDRDSRDQDRNRNWDREGKQNTSMHQGNWNAGGTSHDENYGLGDTSQGSANYGHVDDGSGARFYGTGNYGGYFGSGSDDNDHGSRQHQDRRGYEGRSDYNENRNSNRGRNYQDNDSRSYNSGHSGKGPRYGNSNNPGRGQGTASASGNRYGSTGSGGSGNSGDYYGGGRSSDWNRRGNDRSSGSESGRRDNDWNQDRDWWDKTTDEVSSWFGDEDANRRRKMDERYGEHHGKGPKGYTRSDDKIKDDVEEKLYHDSFIDASDIEVSVNEGEVTLSGTVDNRQTKRRAEDCADAVTGVHDVTNQLKVNRTSGYGSSALSASSSETGSLNSGNTGTLSDSEQKLDQSKDLDRSKNK